VVLVHGEKSEMQRLQHSLLNRYSSKKIEIYAPRNCQTVKLQFRGQKTAKVVGKVAAAGMDHLQKISGLLVHKDFQYMIVEPSELSNYTKLQTCVISQSQRIPFSSSWESLIFQIQEMYEEVEETTFDDKASVRVHNILYVVLTSDVEVTLDWNSSPINDMIADSIAAIILQINQNPSSYQKIPAHKSRQTIEEEKFAQIEKLLVSFYGPVHVDRENKTMKVIFDGTEAIVNLEKQNIVCNDEALKKSLEEILGRLESVYPVGVK